MNKIFFFLGKGGVGKSTLSALTSLFISRKSRVLLVSLDPAHNLSDIFSMKLGSRPKSIARNLSAMEVDEKEFVRSYLKKLESEISAAYSYQTAFNLQGHFDVIKYSPGIEEYALLKAFREITEKQRDRDYIIFDMPPTVVTLKFFRLPHLSLIWLMKLKELRQMIIEKKEIITRIRLGKRELERDRVLRRINESIEEYRSVQSVFQDRARTWLNIIINPDRLSLPESARIERELEEVGLRPEHIIVNKLCQGDCIDEVSRHFHAGKIHIFPQWPGHLVGMETLERYIEDNVESFGFTAP